MRRLDSIRRSILRAKLRVGVSEERARITKEDYLEDEPNGKVSYRKWLEYQEDDAREAVANLTGQNKGIDFRKTIKGTGEKRYQWIAHGIFIDVLDPQEQYIY